MARFAVARLDDIDEIDDGRSPFRPVRHHFGITSFGINAMTAHADGDRLINEHREAEPDSSEELYVVVSGHARFELDGEILFESGDYEEGADRAQALLADNPPYGALYYNTACFESRAGRTEAALTHLRRAV